jgi:hypothetical protein
MRVLHSLNLRFNLYQNISDHRGIPPRLWLGGCLYLIETLYYLVTTIFLVAWKSPAFIL